jgi:hypothetical protein
VKIKYVSCRYLKALTAVAVFAVACFAGSDGASMADDTGLPAEARLAPSTEAPAAGGNKDAGDADSRKTADAVERGHTGPGRPLTTRQKRIFVLGLEASEKN